MSGWERRINSPVQVQPGTDIGNDGHWTVLARWDSLEQGPSIIAAELHGTLPKVASRPNDILTRWVRGDGDRTKRKSHNVGTLKSWAGETVGLEYINTGDLPLKLEAFQNGTAPMEMYAITKVLTPAAYIAERLR